jgi:hypothetical protein
MLIQIRPSDIVLVLSVVCQFCSISTHGSCNDVSMLMDEAFFWNKNKAIIVCFRIKLFLNSIKFGEV